MRVCVCARDGTETKNEEEEEEKIILKLQLLHSKLLFYRCFNGLVVIKFGACVRFSGLCSRFSSLSLSLCVRIWISFICLFESDDEVMRC